MRAQAVVVKELLAFVIGIAILLFVVNLFDDTIGQKLREYSIYENSRLILYHVNSLIKELSLRNASLIYTETLPEKISNVNYRIYIKDSKLCLVTIGQIILEQCIEPSANVSGNFLSGTKIEFKFENNTVYFRNFVNYVPACNPAQCDDNNPCTIDSCIGVSCFNEIVSGYQQGCSYGVGCGGPLCACVDGTCKNICGDGICSEYENPGNCLEDCGPYDIVVPSYYQYSATGDDVVACHFNGSAFVKSKYITRDADTQTFVKFVVYNSSSILAVFSNKSATTNYSLSYSYFTTDWSAPTRFCCDYNLSNWHIPSLSVDNNIFYTISYNYTSENAFAGIVNLTKYITYWDQPVNIYPGGTYIANPSMDAYKGKILVIWDAQETVKYKYYNGYVWQSISNATKHISGGDYDAPHAAIGDNGFVISYVYATSTINLTYYNGTWHSLFVSNVDSDDSGIVYFGDGKYLIVYVFNGVKYRIFDANKFSLSSEYSFPVSLTTLLDLNRDGKHNPILVGADSNSDIYILFFDKYKYSWSYYSIILN